MSHLNYLFEHCIPSGFHNIRYAFILWIKLLQGDYSDYQIYNKHYEKYNEQELFDMLRADFWDRLEDDVLDKDFFEYLIRIKNDAISGKIETTPWNIDEFLEDLYEENKE
jgi:hypothetical protein